jgi:hypothetical protein
MESERRCKVCVKRDLDRGGNGQCPLKAKMRGDFERGVRECRYFKLGDRFVIVHLDEADVPASLF